ncbi:hypothetical protein OAT84_00390 [Gammaproteobacteria bacterium]|nr:hypothetical protein [Gammaproteobacteria bacterium]
MKEVKKALAPVIKIIDQLDKEAVLGIAGVLLLLSFILGGFADLVAVLIGIVIGMAFYKKFF